MRRVGGVPRDRAQRLHVGEPADRVGAHAVERRGLRDRPRSASDPSARPAPAPRPRRSRRRRRRPRGGRAPPRADPRVRVAAGDRRPARPRRRCAPRRRACTRASGSSARERHEHARVFFRRAELRHGREADFRIGGLVFGLDLEAIEERHREPYSIWKFGNVEMWKSFDPSEIEDFQISKFPNFQIANVSYSDSAVSQSAICSRVSRWSSFRWTSIGASGNRFLHPSCGQRFVTSSRQRNSRSR